MSQKTKTITIGDKSFTLKELPVKIIWDLMNDESKEKKKKAVSMLDQGQDLLALACPELSKDTLIGLYPSEIEELWEGFKEVNSAFLGVARTIGLEEALIGVVREVVKSSMKLSALSLLPGTERTPGSKGMGSFFSRFRR